MDRATNGVPNIPEFGTRTTEPGFRSLLAMSTYHQIADGKKYPAVLFTTSTRDDRVHPGHARKMMARMKEQGHDVLLYENVEGGHGGAANYKQQAYMNALAYTFLRQQLR